MAKPPQPAAVALALVLAVATLSSCGGGKSNTALRDPTSDDLTKMVLQREDLPQQFAPVSVCKDQNPVSSSDANSSAAFFETVDRANCVVSFVFLMPSRNEAESAMRNLNQLFEYLNKPIEGVDPNCGTFREVNAPVIGDEARIFASECEVCPPNSAQFYWVQFRIGSLLASPRLLGGRCHRLEEATDYARKQNDRIEAVLRAP